MPVEIGHPIKVAARRSGLTSHVIRVWEKRYRAVSPTRTATNRRLYTDADIERLRILRQAISSGHRISQVASLSTADLVSLLEAEKELDTPSPPLVPRTSPITPSSAPGDTRKIDSFSSTYPDLGELGKPPGFPPRDPGSLLPADPAAWVERCLTAVQRFDAAGLEQELARSAVQFDQLLLFEAVVEPLMQRLGDLWRQGHLRIANEHLATAVVRSFVDSLRAAYPASPSSPHLIVTTPAGQLHEIGALVVSAQAAREGWRVTYLGANLPAQEIARATYQNRARAVALSLAYPEDDPHLGGELVNLRRCLPADTALLVGGRAAGRHRERLERIGAWYLPDLSALQLALAELRAPSSDHAHDYH